MQERAPQVSASSIFSSAWQSEPHPALAAFHEWTGRWRTAPAETRPALLAEGVTLAQARRGVVAGLIHSDPRQAIASAVPMTVRAQLPPEILALLEERVSGVGELALNAVTPAPGMPVAEPVFRTASVGGQTYRAFVYGRREAQATKPKVSLLGVALDGALAVSESPLRVLEPGETPAPGVAVRSEEFGQHAASDPTAVTAVETAGGVVRLCCPQHVADYEARLIHAEDAAGPFEVFSLNDSGSGTGNISGRPPLAWSQGTKKVLFIRVDFTDKTDAPVIPYGGPVIDNTFAVGVINNPGQVRDFYVEGSYQKTTLSVAAAAGGDSPDVTAVFRMPQTAASYAVGNMSGPFDQLLHDHARTAATAAGINLALYDRIGVVFSNLSSGAANTNPIAGSKINYGGRANVQGKNFWINGFFNFGTLIHEFGHTYGLLHANLWQVADGNPVSAGGFSVDYGDPFDPMGFNEVTIANHFSHWEKSLLQWIPDTAVTTVGVSGTYRMHRFDHANASLTNPLALKIVRNGTQDYWIGYRRALPISGPLLSGAYILWGYNAVRESDLLDFNSPGSTPTDSPLIVGQSFSDSVTGINITPLARGGVAPNEYLDVRVNIGAFPGNVAPTVSIAGPSTVAPRQTTAFTATASDADGDALAYSWDFGQGPILENNPSAAFAWNSGGTATVKVTVSDMKGHSVQAAKTVTIADPLEMWWDRDGGTTGEFYALAASPGKVIAVGEEFNPAFRGPIAVSTDGSNWTRTQLGLNQQARAALWDGSKFVVAGADFGAANVGAVFTSPDAVTWTARSVAATTTRLFGIAFGGGKYVAVTDNGAIRYSTDTINWSSAVSGTTAQLVSVSYGGGKFVAIGHNLNASGNGTVLTSPDGVTWTNTSAGAGIETSWQNFDAVFYGGGRFLASGWYSQLRHSLDLGATFQTTRAANEDTPALAFGNGVWFAAGLDRDSGSDIDLISTDGAHWTALPTPIVEDRRAAIFFNNTFITIGRNRSIRQSATFTPAALGYTTWRDGYFPDHGALSTFSADGESDGLGNLLEYTLGRSPFSAAGADGAPALPQSVAVANNPLLSDRVALRFSLPEPAAADLTLVVEVTTNLGGSWAPLATKVGAGAWVWNAGAASRVVLGAPAGGRVQVTVGDAQPFAAGPRRFLRLRSFFNQ